MNRPQSNPQVIHKPSAQASAANPPLKTPEPVAEAPAIQHRVKLLGVGRSSTDPKFFSTYCIEIGWDAQGKLHLLTPEKIRTDIAGLLPMEFRSDPRVAEGAQVNLLEAVWNLKLLLEPTFLHGNYQHVFYRDGL